MTWSLANEPAGNRSELGIVGPGLARFIKDAAAEVRALDDTRFVSIDRQSRAGEPPTSSVYRYLDVLGVNEYFGWYDSYRADLVRPPTTSDELSGYLDEVHAANPNLPLMITEFGAEALRDGPATQPGSSPVPAPLHAPAPAHPRLEALRRGLDRVGVCATSASTRPGPAARRARGPARPGTTRA